MATACFYILVIMSHHKINRALDKREYLMIIFLILIKIICCDPSSELSLRDLTTCSSDEGSQHIFLC